MIAIEIVPLGDLEPHAIRVGLLLTADSRSDIDEGESDSSLSLNSDELLDPVDEGEPFDDEYWSVSGRVRNLAARRFDADTINQLHDSSEPEDSEVRDGTEEL